MPIKVLKIVVQLFEVLNRRVNICSVSLHQLDETYTL